MSTIHFPAPVPRLGAIFFPCCRWQRAAGTHLISRPAYSLRRFPRGLFGTVLSCKDIFTPPVFFAFVCQKGVAGGEVRGWRRSFIFFYVRSYQTGRAGGGPSESIQFAKWSNELHWLRSLDITLPACANVASFLPLSSVTVDLERCMGNNKEGRGCGVKQNEDEEEAQKGRVKSESALFTWQQQKMLPKTIHKAREREGVGVGLAGKWYVYVNYFQSLFHQSRSSKVRARVCVCVLCDFFFQHFSSIYGFPSSWLVDVLIVCRSCPFVPPPNPSPPSPLRVGVWGRGFSGWANSASCREAGRRAELLVYAENKTNFITHAYVKWCATAARNSVNSVLNKTLLHLYTLPLRIGRITLGAALMVAQH